MPVNMFNSNYGVWTKNPYQTLQQSTANRWEQIRREELYGKGAGLSSTFSPSGSSKTFYGYQSSLPTAPAGYNWSLGKESFGAVTYNLTPLSQPSYSSAAQRNQIIDNFSRYGSPSPYRSTNNATSRYGQTTLGTFSSGRLISQSKTPARATQTFSPPPPKVADAIGTPGNDTLIGASGKTQTLRGGKGDDTYLISSAFHSVVENAAEGNDTVVLSVAGHVGLAAFQNVENLILSGSATNAVGNGLNNKIQGNDSNNYINGLGGSDTLTGMGGADTFAFTNTPVFGSSTADHITDFNSREGDTLQVSRSAFGISAPAKTMTVKTVFSSTELQAALATAEAFIYDRPFGELYFNQDSTSAGFGSGGVFAVIDNKAEITAVSLIG